MRIAPALGLALAVTLGLIAAGCSKNEEIRRLTPAESAARVEAGKAVLIDIREPAEWNTTGVVATAQLLSLSDLEGARTKWKPFLEANRDKELILYCRVGNRAGRAGKLLAAEGYSVANGGGFSEWADAGYATRQVKAPPPSAP